MYRGLQASFLSNTLNKFCPQCLMRSQQFSSRSRRLTRLPSQHRLVRGWRALSTSAARLEEAMLAHNPPECAKSHIPRTDHDHHMDPRDFDDHLFHLFSNAEGKVPLTRLQRALKNAGLWKNDPRLTESSTVMNRYVTQAREQGVAEVMLNQAEFEDCVRENIVLIKRAFTGDFVIPEFAHFCGQIDDIYWKCRTNSDGKGYSINPLRMYRGLQASFLSNTLNKFCPQCLMRSQQFSSRSRRLTRLPSQHRLVRGWRALSTSAARLEEAMLAHNPPECAKSHIPRTDHDHHMDPRDFDDHLFHLFSNAEGKVPLTRLQRALKNAGLWKNDPRLTESSTVMNRYVTQAREQGVAEVMLNQAEFEDCVRENIVLIKRAFTGDFVIPEFAHFCGQIDDIYWKCRTNSDGKLSKYSPDYWGVSLCTVDGQRHSIGDVDVPFTLQSSGKPLNYALAINELGEEYVHQFVGHEPSGESFNCIKLSQDNQPHNPMINAGAIVTASLLQRGKSMAERFDYIVGQYKRMNGGEFLGFNNSIFLSEKESAHRNYALGYYMLENKCFPEGSSLDETMNLYFQLCSVELNVNSGAVMAATLANGGYCPITDEEVFNATSVRNTLSLMHSCGMYDYSGGFAFKVGLPAKSAVSGVILLVVPNVMGLCLWSPPLEKMGNSVRGVQFCQELVSRFNFHHYDNLKHTSTLKQDPRVRHSDAQGSRVVNLLFGAYNGDLTALRRMALAGQDMSVADYDGRSALHLASAEGHFECVRFLVEKCHVPLAPTDRWGHTPYDDAVKFNQSAIKAYFEERATPVL